MEIIKKFSFWFFVLLPICLYFLIWYFYCENIPITDDFPAIFLTVSQFKENKSLFQILFQLHNEHIILYDRVIALLSYKLLGVVNFKYLSLIGNLSLLPTSYFFFKSLSSKNLLYILAIPVSVWLFNISNYENMIFAMASLQNNTIILWSTALFYIVCKKDGFDIKEALLISILAFLTIFTSGSGIFACLIVMAYILINRKNKFHYFTLFYLVILVLSFIFLRHGAKNPDLIYLLVNYKVKLIGFFFSFLGNALTYLPYQNYYSNLYEQTIIPMMVGVLMLINFLLLTYKKYYRINPFIYMIILFFIIIALVTAFNRVENDYFYANQPRYRIMGILLLIANFIAFIEFYCRNQLSKFISILIVIFGIIYNVSNFSALKNMNKAIVISMENYLYNPVNYVWSIDQAETKKLFNEFISSKVYSYSPNFRFNSKINSYNSVIKITNNLFSAIESIVSSNKYFKISGFGLLVDYPTKFQSKYLLIENVKNKYIISTELVQRDDVNSYLQKTDSEFSGFNAVIDKTKIQKGDYKVYLLIELEGRQYVNDMNLKISNN